MNELNKLEQIDGIGVFRPAGSYRFQRLVALVTEVILQARDLGLRRLVINSHNLVGFNSPSLSERHWMVREWVEASRGMQKIAFVVPEAFIDPEKFGIFAAANFGVTADVFTNENDAIVWLRQIV